jgi:hypothetical protein
LTFDADSKRLTSPEQTGLGRRGPEASTSRFRVHLSSLARATPETKHMAVRDGCYRSPGTGNAIKHSAILVDLRKWKTWQPAGTRPFLVNSIADCPETVTCDRDGAITNPVGSLVVQCQGGCSLCPSNAPTPEERSNCLPEGGNLHANELSAIARERRALDWAVATPEILFRRDDAARELWQDIPPSGSSVPACADSPPPVVRKPTSCADRSVWTEIRWLGDF